MANPIDCQLRNLRLLPLKDITVRRVATILFRDPVKYTYQLIEGRLADESKIERIDGGFKSFVAELGITELMRDQVINVMYPIFQEIYKWSMFHKHILILNRLFHSREYLKHIHWTYMGTINYRRTAEAMIRDEKVDIGDRFTLACLYCLEDDIQDIWQKLSPLTIEDLHEKLQSFRFRLPGEIVFLWTCILKGQVDKLENFLMGGRFSSIYQYAFETFAAKGYETATQYFFEKLTSEEKDVSLVRTAKAVARNVPSTVECHDVACYLLSQMNPEQLQNVLESSSSAILRIFMDWPRQGAFPKVAKLALPYLNQDDFEQLHLHLAQKFKYLYNAPKLFRDLFLISPKGYRRYTFYLKDLFSYRDTENITFMFRNLNRVETLQLVFSDITLFSCYELVKEDEWYLLEFFIRECRLPKEDRERFAVKLNSYLASPLELDLLERFNQLMYDISDEELIEGPAKKKKKI